MEVELIVAGNGKELKLTGRQIEALLEIYTPKSGKRLKFLPVGSAGLDTLISVASDELNGSVPASLEKNFALRLKGALKIRPGLTLLPTGDLLLVLSRTKKRVKTVSRLPYAVCGDYLIVPADEGVVLAGGRDLIVARFGYKSLEASDPYDRAVRELFGSKITVVEHTGGFQIVEERHTGVVAYGWQRGVGNYVAMVKGETPSLFIPSRNVKSLDLRNTGFEEASDVRIIADAIRSMSAFTEAVKGTPVWDELSPVVNVIGLKRVKKRGKAVLKDKVRIMAGKVITVPFSRP